MDIPILNEMKETLTIVKVGGAVLENPGQRSNLLSAFSRIGGRKMLVHGGGRLATTMASRLGIETRMVGGRRITDGEMLEVVTMVYGGLVNKQVVASLQAAGVNALGLTGADINVIRSHKRPLKDGIDFGFVGDVDEADGQALATLVEEGIVPVMAPLTHDGQGNLLNTNADTIASTVAKAMASLYDVALCFCFEKRGVLTGPEDNSDIVPLINRQTFRELVESGVVSGGMIPKIENALEAVDSGVARVLITDIEGIDGSHGTIITR